MNCELFDHDLKIVYLQQSFQTICIIEIFYVNYYKKYLLMVLDQRLTAEFFLTAVNFKDINNYLLKSIASQNMKVVFPKLVYSLNTSITTIRILSW